MSGQFVVYWLGYATALPALNTLPAGIDVINLFVLNLTTGSSGTTLDTSFISSGGQSWATTLSQAQAARANGVKVCASIIPPKGGLTWNTIPDPTTFASNVQQLIDTWQLDGIDIDPEQGALNPPGGNFTAVMTALGQYFGPQSGTGQRMSYASFDYSFDQPFLSQNAALFDDITLMGYTWTYQQMLVQFQMYSSLVPSQNLLFGIDPTKTPQQESIELAKWQPTSGSKGGMMEFNINGDTDFATAQAILAGMGGSARG